MKIREMMKYRFSRLDYQKEGSPRKWRWPKATMYYAGNMVAVNWWRLVLWIERKTWKSPEGKVVLSKIDFVHALAWMNEKGYMLRAESGSYWKRWAVYTASSESPGLMTLRGIGPTCLEAILHAMENEDSKENLVTTNKPTT